MLSRLVILTCSYFCLIFIFTGCSDDSVTSTGGVYTSDTGSFTYPLKSGSTWSFKRTIKAEDIRPDSIRHYFSNYPLMTYGTAAVLYDTVINGINTACILETYNSGQYSSVSRQYMINTDTACIEYAARGYSNFNSFLKPIGNKIYLLNTDNIIPDEEIRINNPPCEILKYPVLTGKEWTTYKNLGLIRTIEKKYMGWQTLQIQANYIKCIETRCIFDLMAQAPYYAYYSKFGLLKQYVFYDNFLITTEIYPEGIGYADFTDTYLVTSFNIQ